MRIHPAAWVPLILLSTAPLSAQSPDPSAPAPVVLPAAVPADPLPAARGRGSIVFGDALAASVLRFTSSPGFDAKKASDVNDLGFIYLHFGNYEDAAEQFERAAALAPGYPDPLVNLAVVAYRTGDPAGARKRLLEAARLKGREGEIQYNLGLLDHEEKRAEQAKQRLEKASRILPGDPEVWTGLGCVRYALQDIEGAYQAFRKARETGADFHEAHFNLALAALRTGRKDEALEASREAVRLLPDDPQVLNLLGIAFLEGKQYSKASLAFAEAIRQYPGNAFYYNHLGRAQLGEGRENDAERSFLKALDLSPRARQVQWNLADLRLRQGRFQEALALYDEASNLAAARKSPVFLYNRGVAAYKAGKREEAFGDWKASWALDPRYPEPLYAMALAHADAGKWPDAQDLAAKGERLEPSSSRWVRLLADIAWERKDPARALKSYRRAVEFGDRDVVLLRRIERLEKGGDLAEPPAEFPEDSPGRLRPRVERVLEEGEGKTAIQLAEQGVRRWPDDPAAWELLADARRGAGFLAEARKAMEKALSLAPKDARLVEAFGEISFEMADFKSAEVSFRRASALSGSSVKAPLGLGSSLFKQYRIEDALDAWKTGLLEFPSSPELHYNLGRANHELGRAALAGVYYGKALSLRPGYAEALTNQAVLDLEAGRLKEARRKLAASLKLNPALPETHFNLGNTALRDGQFDEALRHYEKGISLSPRDPDGHYHMGVAWIKRSQWSRARPLMEKTLELDPKHPDALYNMGRIILETGDPDRAMKFFEESLSVKPGQADAHFGIGLLRYQRGDLNGAEKHLKRAVEGPRTAPEALYYLGRVHEKRGDDGSAEIAYRQAARLDPALGLPSLALGELMRSKGRNGEARKEYEAALKANDLKVVEEARERMRDLP